MTIRKLLLPTCIAAALVVPAAFAHGGGNGNGHGHGNAHGMAVQQAGIDARANGDQVGDDVRSVARDDSEGAEHANAHAVAHANANSAVISGTDIDESSEVGGEPPKHSHKTRKTHASHKHGTGGKMPL